MDATGIVNPDTFMTVIETLQNQISVTQVVTVLGAAAGVAVSFAFMWWGVRKLIRVLMSAFKKGKVSL